MGVVRSVAPLRTPIRPREPLPGRLLPRKALQNEAPLFLGLDFGTSGARATVINQAALPVEEIKMPYDKQPTEQWDVAWRRALDSIFEELADELRTSIASVAFDGTSSTTLLMDQSTGISLEPPQWYNASQSQPAVDYAERIAPEGHPGRASTSTLCKVIEWHLRRSWQRHRDAGKCPRVLHQADWLSYLLHGDCRQSDYTNALKLGYDPATESYPEWLQAEEFFPLLPSRVVAPGTPVGRVLESVRERYRLREHCLVCAGTTDSIAAFLASGAKEIGEAVTSLGSTLAIKMFSETRVDAVDYGVYSHRLGDKWLVGGASNTGGAVLKQYFTDSELKTLTDGIDAEQPSGLDYYPLTSPGERFPVNDPKFLPCLEPRPDDDARFLHGRTATTTAVESRRPLGMLEGIASIEGQCYRLLETLGAGPVRNIWTAGGGAVNEKWTHMRRRELRIPIEPAPYGEASYGAALLAKQGYELETR